MRWGMSPLFWVIAAYLGVLLGRLVMDAAASPSPPLTGTHAVWLGLGVPIVFVGMVAAVAAWLDRRG